MSKFLKVAVKLLTDSHISRYQKEAQRLQKKLARTSQLIGKLHSDPEYLLSHQCQFCSFKGPEEEVERHESACFARTKRRQDQNTFGCKYCDFDANQKHQVVIHEATCPSKQQVGTQNVWPLS